MGAHSAQEIGIRVAGDGDADRWNRFITQSDSPSPLARFEWRRVLEATYGVETRFFIAERDEKVVGTLPTYTTRGISGRRSTYSLRFGLRAQDPSVADSLMRPLAHAVDEERLSEALLTSGFHALTDTWPVDRKTTIGLTIGANEEETWRSLRDKTRNMIRKAEKAGVEVVRGRERVGDFYAHYRHNMLRLGLQFHGSAFFRNILLEFGDDTEILVASVGNKPIASMLLLFNGEFACYPYQSALHEHRRYAPIQLLNWHAMRRCMERGARWLDMGESSRDSPVYRSKVNFGGVPRDVYYYALNRQRAPREQGDVGLAAPHTKSPKHRIDEYLRQSAPAFFRERYARWRQRHGRMV